MSSGRSCGDLPAPIPQGPITSPPWPGTCSARDHAEPAFRFDPLGSYAHTYVQQGADRAFVMGLLDRPLIDESLFTCLQEAGPEARFEVGTLTAADHPNTVDIELFSDGGKRLELRASSIGGGEVEITQIDGWAVCLRGTAFEALVEVESTAIEFLATLLLSDGAALGQPVMQTKGSRTMVIAHRKARLPDLMRRQLEGLPGCTWREARPVYFLQAGSPLFCSAQEMITMAEACQLSLGRLALVYEAQRLALPETQILDEMVRRYRILKQAALLGLDPEMTGMQLLEPSAGSLMQACEPGRLAVGGIHTRAAA